MKHTLFLCRENGATLIEVLIAVLILSIGLLAMGAMMTYATLLPKSSGNRSIAMSTATDMIERMRANPSTASPLFSITAYDTTTFTTTFVTSTALTSSCTFPSCTQASMAAMDIAAVQQQLSQQLNPAGITIAATNAAANEGNLWIIWQEPSSFGSASTANSDNCPAAIVTAAFAPTPRCVYLPFKL